jgi:hypothetical protein
VLYNKTFGDFGKMFCTPMDDIVTKTSKIEATVKHGMVGQWEQVDEAEDYFVINKALSSDGEDKVLGKRPGDLLVISEQEE